MKKENRMNWRTHDVFNQFSELSELADLKGRMQG
jgi:hypothetical protein